MARQPYVYSAFHAASEQLNVLYIKQIKNNNDNIIVIIMINIRYVAKDFKSYSQWCKTEN